MDRLKHRRRVIIALCAVLLAVVCVCGGIFGMRWLNEATGRNSFKTLNNMSQEEAAQQLYAQKHPYIGRMPDIQMLTFPAGWQSYGSWLHTLQEPYGYQQYFYTDKEGYDAFLADPAQQTLLQKNALILMALVENCDYVKWTLKWSDGAVEHSDYAFDTSLNEMANGGATFTYTEQWANEALGGDIGAQAETMETFRTFLGRLDSLTPALIEPEIE